MAARMANLNQGLRFALNFRLIRLGKQPAKGNFGAKIGVQESTE
jgi:hypothetical protein